MRTHGLLMALGMLAGFPLLLQAEEQVANPPITPVDHSEELEIADAKVTYNAELDQLVFEMEVIGNAGEVVPKPRGQMNGAPVLAYVFPTTLSSEDIGFGKTEGIVALAITSHPDFDDTPLWDENSDGKYDNDGRVYHSHWVVLTSDKRAGGELAVKEFGEEEQALTPPTHPGMPIYLDSPGFPVILDGPKLRVPVPASRIDGKTDFRFDAVTSYLQVMKSKDTPLLGVYKIYDVLSSDLSLPKTVQQQE